jgi:hypothetical protein
MAYQQEGKQPAQTITGCLNEEEYTRQFAGDSRNNPSLQPVRPGMAPTFPVPDPDSSDHATNVRNEGQQQSFEDAPPRGTTFYPNTSHSKA